MKSLGWLIAAANAALMLLQPANVEAQTDWTYNPVPGIVCREGGVAGLAIRRAPSPTNRIVIVMQGGGSCQDKASCDNNPKEFREDTEYAKARSTYLNEGIFYRFSPNNPFAQYHQVFLPYCSGDMHAGSAVRVITDGATSVTETHNGYDNSLRFFQFIKDKFASELAQPDATVMLAGISAGGFGAIFNAPRLRALLPANVRMILLQDSSPALDDTALTPCFANSLASYFNFRGTFLQSCGSACGSSNWLPSWQNFMLNTYRSMPQALISGSADNIVISLVRAGFPGCSANTAFDAAALQTQLRANRTRMKNASTFYGTPTGTFFISDWDINWIHTWLNLPTYYGSPLHETRAVNQALSTVLLRDWTPALYDHNPGWLDHVGLWY